jgi:hypothetical protein
MSIPAHSAINETGRFYTWSDQKFYSVTTILNVLSKPGLSSWITKEAVKKSLQLYRDGSLGELIDEMGEQAAIAHLSKASNQARDESAKLGSRVHDYIEQEIAGLEPEVTPEIKGFADQFELFKEKYSPKFTHSEAQVFNRKAAYAGTLDAICVIGDETVIIDTKTGKSVYPTVALQLAAYSRAEFLADVNGIDEHRMPEIHSAAVLHLRPRSYHFTEVNISDEIYNAFRYVQQAFLWEHQTSKNAFGGEFPTIDLEDE